MGSGTDSRIGVLRPESPMLTLAPTAFANLYSNATLADCRRRNKRDRIALVVLHKLGLYDDCSVNWIFVVIYYVASRALSSIYLDTYDVRCLAVYAFENAPHEQASRSLPLCVISALRHGMIVSHWYHTVVIVCDPMMTR